MKYPLESPKQELQSQRRESQYVKLHQHCMSLGSRKKWTSDDFQQRPIDVPVVIKRTNRQEVREKKIEEQKSEESKEEELFSPISHYVCGYKTIQKTNKQPISSIWISHSTNFSLASHKLPSLVTIPNYPNNPYLLGILPNTQNLPYNPSITHNLIFPP